MCCCPSFKTWVLIIASIAMIVIVTLSSTSSRAVGKVESVMQYLPTPHVEITFGAVYGGRKGEDDGPMYDLETSLRISGYDVERGVLAPLTGDSCQNCMGSPDQTNPHFAVLFKDPYQTQPGCLYGQTDLSYCFHLESDEAIIILADGPPYETFSEFSWGVYLYDTLSGVERFLIEAGVSVPVRPKRSGRMMLIASYMPDILDNLGENMMLPDIDRRNTYFVQLSTALIETQQEPRFNDRLSIVLKTLIDDEDGAGAFYDKLPTQTQILKIRIADSETRNLVRGGPTFNEHPLGFISNQEMTENNYANSIIEQIIQTVTSQKAVIYRSKMVKSLSVLNIAGPKDCVSNVIDCLAEDWDVSYMVSAGFSLPASRDYSLLIIGVDHPEGRRTTLGMFDAQTNKEIMPLPAGQDSNDMIYVLWIARDCSMRFKPCVEIDIPESKEFYLRERSYGTNSNANFVQPSILLLKDF